MSKNKEQTAQDFAVNFNNQLFQLSHFKDKHHTPLVDSLFNKESLNLVYASAGGMKSMLMLDLALRLSSGDNFLGYQCQKSRVLYVDAEMSDADIGERLQFFNAGNPDNLLYMKNGNTSFDFMLKEQQDGFIQFLEEQEDKLEVIFFDNLRTMALFNNENDSSQFQQVNRFLIKLRDLGLAIFLIHHSNKDGETYAGSSNITTPFDTVFGLVDSGYQGMRQIKVQKNRGSNSGLNELDNQLISPCSITGRMVLNQTNYKSEADIARELINRLDSGKIKKFEDIKISLRELGYRFRSGTVTQKTFIEFLKEHAETSHPYKDVSDLRKAYIKEPIWDEEDLTEEFFH